MLVGRRVSWLHEDEHRAGFLYGTIVWVDSTNPQMLIEPDHDPEQSVTLLCKSYCEIQLEGEPPFATQADYEQWRQKDADHEQWRQKELDQISIRERGRPMTDDEILDRIELRDRMRGPKLQQENS